MMSSSKPPRKNVIVTSKRLVAKRPPNEQPLPPAKKQAVVVAVKPKTASPRVQSSPKPVAAAQPKKPPVISRSPKTIVVPSKAKKKAEAKKQDDEEEKLSELLEVCGEDDVQDEESEEEEVAEGAAAVKELQRALRQPAKASRAIVSKPKPPKTYDCFEVAIKMAKGMVKSFVAVRMTGENGSEQMSKHLLALQRICFTALESIAREAVPRSQHSLFISKIEEICKAVGMENVVEEVVQHRIVSPERTESSPGKREVTVSPVKVPSPPPSLEDNAMEEANQAQEQTPQAIVEQQQAIVDALDDTLVPLDVYGTAAAPANYDV
eukprot:TRINITY_DN1280_c0_g1_i1.p2 TRINITY_DN1280_c0_g1~~TRINITY_DN1280_c0_g1_i1.p2  ORF type:complete len:375 (-),score=60.81 TRINITY_DN1280_c0_g1_i1:5272-6237(-)